MQQSTPHIDDAPHESAQQQQKPNERVYARGILNDLANGVQPLYKPEWAGPFDKHISMLISEYDPNDLASFNTMLETVKTKFPEVRRLVEEGENTNPDYTTSPSGKTIFKTFDMDDVLDLPDVEWLISGILQRSTTTLVVGTGNVGKTFVWLDACLSIALGAKWLGRRTMQGRVLYVYAEGAGGLKQRIKAIMMERGLMDSSGKRTGEKPAITFIPRPVHLLSDKQTLMDTIEAEKELYGVYPEEVVIDTFSMCASGVDENSNSQVAQFMGTATDIKLKYKCHVTVIHHENKNGGFRGASALRDNVDTMLKLVRQDKDGPIKVVCDKQRDGEYFPNFMLNLKIVQVGINTYTNEPITSCVVELATEDSEPSASSTMPEKQVKMLDILTLHGSLPTGQWQKRCNEEADISRDSFNYNLKILVDTGKVQKTEYLSGKQQRVSYSIPKANTDVDYDD